ncbi:hypothetical protein PV721_27915 [Streptomyces sp. MB09-01]|uniref:hypothetical protein n=1 Tax=Streptomyces sp. MB09-01 TaxID=3028666 RepID=UPI0029A1227A|nr:hypothetical protein [Streptomyces sp. MB09-01]MDX3538112.1 hypothetical protein [Streptomyces sp. MB09-01]
MLLNPEKTLFVRGATPVLLLSDAPVHDVLPVLTAPDGTVPRCEGWTIVPKLTLCVVDGPGEAGLIVPALAALVIDSAGGGTDPHDMADWCADAERAGGAVVLHSTHCPRRWTGPTCWAPALPTADSWPA